VGRKFRTFLYGRAWTHAEGPVALFDHATAWLRRNRVLLPGVHVLARQVSAARTAAEDRLHATVARATRRADPALSPALVGLLAVPAGQRRSELERLRRPPTRSTGRVMARALDRVNEISGFGLGRVNLSRVPVNRLAVLARYGMASKAAALERASEPRRTAVVTAVMRNLQAQAIDDALDLFALLMATRLISPAKRASERERLASLPNLERASRTVTRASRLLLRLLAEADAAGQSLDPPLVWTMLDDVAPRETIVAAMSMVDKLVPADDGSAEVALRTALAGRYNTVRPFLVLLGESPALAAAQGGKRVLAAVRKLPALTRHKPAKRPLKPHKIDAELVPRTWRPAVFANPALPEGTVDRDAYVVCVLEQLHRALSRRDVYATPSNRWSDPRARLLVGAQWEAVRADVLAGLSLDTPVAEHLGELTAGLDAAWRQMAARIGRSRTGRQGRGPRATRRRTSAAECEQARRARRAGVADLVAGHDRGDAAPHRPARPAVRGELLDRIPRGVHPPLGRHLPHGGVGDLPGGVVGRGGLQHRPDPGDQPALPAADPLPTLACGPELPARGHDRRGERDADRSPGAHPARPVLGWWAARLRGRPAVRGPGAHHQRGPVAEVLRLQTGHHLAQRRQRPGVRDRGGPEMVATDHASYSDMVFGLFKMLGYRFSPRLRDLSDQRFWRADVPGEAAGDYGPLNVVARNKVALGKIETHWPDMLRVAGSLITNQVRAYDLLRMFGREGRLSPLGQAFAEYGRIEKTMHLLALCDPVDDSYRRRMNRQLTVQESRHCLARAICHGKRGTIVQAYRDGQEDQLAALGLVLNAVVLWTTRYLDAAVAELETAGHLIGAADKARLSPLKDKHLNCLGRYAFTASQPAAGLRPLRDPAAPEDTDTE